MGVLSTYQLEDAESNEPTPESLGCREVTGKSSPSRRMGFPSMAVEWKVLERNKGLF